MTRRGSTTAIAGSRHVDASGGPADGQTIADWRRLWGRPPNVDVAVAADVPEFLRRLVERVGALAAERATA